MNAEPEAESCPSPDLLAELDREAPSSPVHAYIINLPAFQVGRPVFEELPDNALEQLGDEPEGLLELACAPSRKFRTIDDFDDEPAPAKPVDPRQLSIFDKPLEPAASSPAPAEAPVWPHVRPPSRKRSPFFQVDELDN